MSILDFFKRALTPATALEESNSTLGDIFTAPKNYSGVSVTETSAMQLSAVGAAVKVISDSVASQVVSPFLTKNDITKVYREHPTFKLLGLRANKNMSAFTFVQTIQSHALRWGNGYAYIDLDSRGNVSGLYPLAPWATMVHEHEGEIYYQTAILGRTMPDTITFHSDQVLHIKNLGSDGYVGKSPIRQHAEEIGIQIAAQNFGAEFFGNGAVIQGYLHLPGALKSEHKEQIKKSWSSVMSGSGNRHRTPVLSDGMEYKKIGIPPEEAQFLETRRYGDAKIAQIYNLPPHIISDLSKATFSNITEETINFLRRTLNPIFINWEQELQYKLLSTNEQKRIHFRFDRSKILQGTPKDDALTDVSLVNAGIITRNEARDKRNLNPIDGLDNVLVPLNMVEVDEDGELVKSSEDKEQEKEQERKIDPTPLFKHFSVRFEKVLSNAKKSFDIDDYVRKNLGPTCEAIGRTDVLDAFLCDMKLVRTNEQVKEKVTQELIFQTLRGHYGD